jgi:hypothetical protein
MSKAPTAPQSGQMNGSGQVSAQQNAAQGQSPKAFGRIGIPAIAAATEVLKSKKTETKPQANPYYLRDYD